MACPVCGGDQFQHEPDLDIVQCSCCGRMSSKQELVRANKPNIDVEVNSMKSELSVEIRKAFRKSVSRSKHFKLK
jgi:uncharacterized Zn finger protein (UPF0148 family)